MSYQPLPEKHQHTSDFPRLSDSGRKFESSNSAFAQLIPVVLDRRMRIGHFDQDGDIISFG